MEPFRNTPESLEREPRKQISLFVPLSVYRLIRDEAARQRVPMTELVRGWVKEPLEELAAANEE